MEALYPVCITYASIRPRLLSAFGQDKDCGWDAYLNSQGTSLARLLARLPSLKVLAIYCAHRFVLNHAIFLQPCLQLRSIHFAEENPYGKDRDQYKPSYPHPVGHSLHLAMAKHHIPVFEKLEIGFKDDLSFIIEAVRAGHLTRIKELQIESCNDQPLQLRSLLEAFLAHETKLEAVAVELETNRSDDLITRDLMHQLLASPVCSNLHKLHVWPADKDEASSAMLFVSDYLRGAGAGGKPS